MYYAEDFLEQYSQFSSMLLTFEELQGQLKNQIDKRVRDRLAGKPAEKAPNKPPMPQPIAGPMPVVKPGNPFGKILEGNPGKSDVSNDSYSDVSVNHHPKQNPVDPPRFGGSQNGPIQLPGPHRPPEAPVVIPPQPTGPSQSEQVNQLQTRLKQAESELMQARAMIDEHRRSQDSLQESIRGLRDEKTRLERALDQEKKRGDQALKSSGLAAGNLEATKMLKERIKDLETEIDLMNGQNAKLLEALKAANSAQNSNQGNLGFSLGPSRDDLELRQTIQTLNRKLEMAEAENRLLKENISRASEGQRVNSNLNGDYSEKIIRLESENQVLKKGNSTLPRSG